MGSNFNQIAYEYESFHSLVAHCRSRDADAISLHAELTRLRAELDEARRHAKVLWSASLVSIAKAPPCYKPTPALADAIAYVEKLL